MSTRSKKSHGTTAPDVTAPDATASDPPLGQCETVTLFTYVHCILFTVPSVISESLGSDGVTAPKKGTKFCMCIHVHMCTYVVYCVDNVHALLLQCNYLTIFVQVRGQALGQATTCVM